MVDDSETRSTRAAAGAPTLDGPAGYATTQPAAEGSTGEETIVPTWGSSTFATLPDPGYQLGELIGRGGMGEVVVAQDQRIGREVAVKRIRSHAPSPDAVMRFLREARIQARLDHPAIVPVYELGTDADGRPYFTMKRLAGVTLAKRLAEGGPIQPLLRAFIDVCQAIGLAHSRGVVHRDLKPSNIMLGDYGEVYVLDWGIARVLTDRRRDTHPGIADDVDEGTTVGAILGTPGFMAPEQVRGLDCGPPADIYALGAILFEILAGQSLHPHGEAGLATTLTQPQEAPAKRATDRSIPPELDEACFQTLAEDPDQRPTARSLAALLQAYVDGDRDLERRRALAAEQLDAARIAFASTSDDARATAMRRAGRALALDPESTEAAAIVTTLILEPPRTLPPELVDSLETEDREFNRSRAKLSIWSYVALFAFLPALPFFGVKNWPGIAGFYAVITIGAVHSWEVSRHGRSRAQIVLVILTMMMLMFTRVLGPFILTPIIGCCVLIAITAIPHFTDRPRLVIGWVLVASLLPVVLEWSGVLDRTWTIAGGFIVTTSDVFMLRGHVIDNVALVVANIGFIVVTGAVALAINRRRRAAQRQLHIQAWHLRQLLPASTRPWHTRPTGKAP